MRRWLPVLATLGVFASLLVWGPELADAAKVAAKAKKKARAPARPWTTPAMRAAALRKVTDYLAASTVKETLDQPGALVPVFEQLYRVTATPNALAVHLMQFGDSHTAADEFTGNLRDLFKERFGDGGSGFSLAGHPFAGYRRFDARGGGTTGWHTEGLRSASGDGYFGLGGVSISTERAGQSVYIDTECDTLEIHYLQQPDGGELALYDTDQLVEQFSTQGEMGPGFVRFDVPQGPHRFVLKTLEPSPVRLFGWVADRRAGVTYEALGINGAEASVMLRWNAEMLATYLQRRSPGMIVLAYGTNEASDPNWDPASYQTMFNSLLEHLRAAVPAASILVLGPPDRWVLRRGKWQLVEGIDGIINSERNACRQNGCTFWDARERMGGRGSMHDWVVAGLAQADHVHFTAAGYKRLASVLFDDLTAQYTAFKRVRQEVSDQIAHGQPNQDR